MNRCVAPISWLTSISSFCVRICSRIVLPVTNTTATESTAPSRSTMRSAKLAKRVSFCAHSKSMPTCSTNGMATIALRIAARDSGSADAGLMAIACGKGLASIAASKSATDPTRFISARAASREMKVTAFAFGSARKRFSNSRASASVAFSTR